MTNEREHALAVIAIDFGTTYSSVGVVRDEKIYIVSDDHGNIKMPSYVAFTDDGCVIGEDALDQAALNPYNTIYDIKRLLGMNIDTLPTRSCVNNWPFEVVNEINKTKIKITHRGETHTISTEEICAMVLSKLKKMAESYLGENVANVILTIPDNFNGAQRRAIVEASRIAGLNILRIISDSIATGIAYGLDQVTEKCNVLVFDLGGGAFDVSVLSVADGVFEVKASSGDSLTGGEEFDSRLVSFFVEEIRREHGKDISGDACAMRRLRAACERAKRVLSCAEQTSVEVEALFDGVDLRALVTRERFESLCEDLFLLIFQHLESILVVANLPRTQIDQVLLVGGSTRMPKIRQMMMSFFDKDFAQSVAPEEAVVIGATMQAAIVCSEGPIVTSPLSIGIEAPGAVMTVIIPRKSTLPVQKTVNYTTYRDYQHAVTLHVYEGERLLAPYNTALGTLSLEGIPPLPRGVPQIDITFDLDVSGLLTVTALERSTGVTNHIAVVTSKDRITEEQVEKIVLDSERFREEDESERDRLVARDLFETCLMNVKHALSAPDVFESMEEEEHMWYMHMMQQEIQWLKRNPMAERTVYARKTIDLQIVYLSVIVDMFHEDLDHELRMRREG